MDNLPGDLQLYDEYHALIVRSWQGILPEISSFVRKVPARPLPSLGVQIEGYFRPAASIFFRRSHNILKNK